ncbi:beta-propeller fold lactonase family protein [Streptomyces sp. NBC_01306]|uniref:beta-propeller fold lactonase family protein n=1 Tax=Streptomyces sp. NBC_01306 TaxID=2903819 RepID=UPI00224F591D|nr:beta-propeller fold lactonase family protein [Streptomyces sp. NBC_01306]MCX4725702.1 beta-propeller fold lactonase family protein [Streptomyces sp. NBC_01306]
MSAQAAAGPHHGHPGHHAHRHGGHEVLWTTPSSVSKDDNTELVGVDPATGKEVARFGIGQEAETWGIALSKDQHTAYLANHHSGTLSVADLVGHKLVKEIPLGVDADAIALSPDGRTAYVTSMIMQSLSVVDLTTGTVVRTVDLGAPAQGVVISPDGRTAYLGIYSRDRIDRMDLSDYKVTASYTGGQAPREVLLSHDGKTLYATDYYGGTVSVYRADNPAAKPRQAQVGGEPFKAQLSRDGKSLYVANTAESSVSVVDTRTLKTRRIAVPDSFGTLALAPNGKQLFQAQENQAGITPIDLRAGKATGTLDAAGLPQASSLALTSD